jgi:hypothetical protein
VVRNPRLAIDPFRWRLSNSNRSVVAAALAVACQRASGKSPSHPATFFYPFIALF